VATKPRLLLKYPYPPQWIQAIKNNLLHKVESITEKADSL
jgi:hypothetical protein